MCSTQLTREDDDDELPRPAFRDDGPHRLAEAVDQGLRAYMLKVYNYMASALAVTGLVAWFVAHTPAVFQLLYTVGRAAAFSRASWATW